MRRKKKKINRYLFPLLCFAILYWCYYSQQRNTSESNTSEQRTELPEGLPKGDTAYLPTTQKGSLQYRKHYTLSYAGEDRLTEWVAYELTRSELIKKVERSGKFRKDPNLKNCVTAKDYKGSGYDRGHLAPAGDMTFSEQAMEESFFMSNMAPQVPAFNRGIWKKTEEQIREWVKNEGTLYVVTGSLWTETSERMAACKIPIPDYFYKTVFDMQTPSKGMITFCIPNKALRGSPFDYVITVDSLEKLTGIDFFSQLPDTIEEALEKEVKKQLWR